MKATATKLLDFLRKSPQFNIPIYQRTYSWTEKECRQLWDDILRTGSNEKIPAHFVGSIVYIEAGLYQVSVQSPLLVIDGQQRLTTLTLVLTAMAQALEKLDEGSREPVDGFSPLKLRNRYLINAEETGERRHKLILSQTDKDTLIALTNGYDPPHERSVRVMQNFAHFQSWIAERKGDLVSLCNGLAKLVVVDVALSRDQDNPQLIFESMNSTGRELTQADLIRNFILMGLELDLQTRLYQQYWRPMEVDFGQEAYGTHFDGFMRYYLTVKTGDIPNVRDVYEAFKDYAHPSLAKGEVEALVADIRTYSRYFCAMALGAESDAHLKVTFQDLRELKVDVAYPFLLELYHDYANGVLACAEYVAAVRLVEAYVFRRAICAIPTASMNKTFATFSKALKKDRYLESIQAHLLLLPSYRRFPTDEEFQRDFQTRDLYNFRSRSYWLRRLENHKRKEHVLVDEYTIEHIMPQELPVAWKTALGADWERIHNTWLHTPGNLTLTAYNSDYSNRPFINKRDMPDAPEKALRVSPLNLNQGLGQLDHWGEDTIRSRADRLAGTALEVWPAPKLPTEVLMAYKPHKQASGHTIDGQSNLVTAKVRKWFKPLRKAVKLLDPCGSEYFLKRYIAYKAETNCVDEIPKAKRLVLPLKIPVANPDDLKGIAEDISGLGSWGNGYVEIRLTSVDEVLYVTKLVQQAFEKQLSNGNDA